MFNPNEDGVTHINVYSKGRTELGRSLTNLAPTPFRHPHLGEFKCVEGFWYMFVTCQAQFQRMDGWTAKREGDKAHRVREMDKATLKEVYLLKLQYNPRIKDMLLANTLPLEHYYVYGDKVVSNRYTWTAKLWEEIATELRG
jgi:hypothetical protein